LFSKELVNSLKPIDEKVDVWLSSFLCITSLYYLAVDLCYERREAALIAGNSDGVRKHVFPASELSRKRLIWPEVQYVERSILWGMLCRQGKECKGQQARSNLLLVAYN